MYHASIWHCIRPWVGMKGHEIEILVCPDRVVDVNMKDYQSAIDCVRQNQDAFAVVSLAPAHVRENKYTYAVVFEGRYIYGTAVGREIAILESRREYAKANTHKMRYDSEPEYALEHEITQFDRYSAYSDDAGVVRAGDQHLAVIRALEQKVNDPEKVRALWEKHGKS